MTNISELNKLKTTPRVCICIPTYNAESTIRETIKSILSQTYSNLVIKISDNNSSDNTLHIIEEFKDSRIKIHRHNVNVGGEGNFTRCIQMASDKYTAIFHADDVYEPSMVAKQVAFLEENSNISAVFTKAFLIDEQGDKLGIVGDVPGIKIGVAQLNFNTLFKKILLHHNFLVCPSALVRTQVYREEVKEWGNSVFLSASDVDMWLKFARNKKIAVLEERLMSYRISRAQFSHRNRNRTKRADFFLVIDHYLAQEDVKSFLTKSDLRHYAWLARHDKVACAFNLFILERVPEAKDMMKGFFCWDSIHAAMLTRRGIVTLGGAALLSLLILFGVSKTTIAIVKAAKNTRWR